jgi:ATP-dependent exoDNAse (exonuclease V) beta subunit
VTPSAPRIQRATQNCIVEASAGTGKTRELVNRIVAAVVEGCRIERVVAVTFTIAAAGEMKLRLRQELDQARRDEMLSVEGRGRASEALQHLERAFIGTIHSFCAQMLRQRPVEARVDPAFTEMDQAESFALFGREFQAWMQERLAFGPPIFGRLFARLSWGDRDPAESLKKAAWGLTEWRDFPAPWQRQPLALHQLVDAVMRQIERVLRMRDQCERPRADTLYQSLQPVADCLDRYNTARQIGRTDYESWESNILRLPKDVWLKQGYGVFSPAVSREAMIAAWERLREDIETFRERADADLAGALRDELWPMVERYQAAKDRLGKLDFTDLLIAARKLLHNGDALQHFRSRYERLFIDEFQDTDPLQAEILRMLCEDKLFLVGDPKQSIYRFRRADVELYGQIRNELVDGGATRVELSASRRSIAPIQDFVNAAFQDMPGYIPLTKGREAHPDQPAIIALPMPKPYSEKTPKITKTAIDGCAPSTVAAFIEWLLALKWRVSERDDPAVTREIEASDICILLRRFTKWVGGANIDITADYVRCLEARGIRHVLVGSKSFHSREEVLAVRAALRAIEWPDDELSVFATLRGSMLAVHDGTLLKFRHRYGSLHPLKKLPQDLDAEFKPVQDILALLADLHRGRNSRPIADTITRLLEHARAHAGLALRKGGERVLANVLRLTDLSRQFEAGAATSFRSFIDNLDDQETAGESSDPTVFEQEGEGVRLMTVHKAKGLEFPVVILADLTCRLTSDRADRFVDASRGLCAQPLMGLRPWELLDPQNLAVEQRLNRDEGERIAYVAATRARDLLVVSAVGERQSDILDESWLSPLHDALYPEDNRFRKPFPPTGCEFHGDATVLNRHRDCGPEEISVKPGLHQPRRGKHSVVWVDPKALNLQETASQGLQLEEVLTGSAEEGLAKYREWQANQATTVERGRIPSLAIERATEARLEDSKVELVSIEKQGIRPSGQAFGKLVHALLQQAQFPVKEAELRKIAQVEARILESSESDIDPAVQVALGALRHPLLQGIGTAVRVHREFPVMLRRDGRMIEGVIDLAFSDGRSWTIVDFKTGPADKKRNRGQLGLYREALESSTALPVRAVLFEI